MSRFWYLIKQLLSFYVSWHKLSSLDMLYLSWPLAAVNIKSTDSTSVKLYYFIWDLLLPERGCLMYGIGLQHNAPLNAVIQNNVTSYDIHGNLRTQFKLIFLVNPALISYMYLQCLRVFSVLSVSCIKGVPTEKQTFNQIMMFVKIIKELLRSYR